MNYTGSHLQWRLNNKSAELIEKFLQKSGIPALPAEKLHATVFETCIPDFKIRPKSVSAQIQPNKMGLHFGAVDTQVLMIIFANDAINARYNELRSIEDGFIKRRNYHLPVRYTLRPHIQISQFVKNKESVPKEKLLEILEFFRKSPIVFSSEFVADKDLKPNMLPIVRKQQMSDEQRAANNRARIGKALVMERYRMNKDSRLHSFLSFLRNVKTYMS